jgi:energy-coupling factor transporter transmembrane protein EcfT
VTVRVYSKSQIRTRFDREKFRLLDGLLLLISVALIVTASGGLLQ